MIARIAEGDKEDVDLAVKAARAAFDNGPWPRFPGAVCVYYSKPSLFNPYYFYLFRPFKTLSSMSCPYFLFYFNDQYLKTKN